MGDQYNVKNEGQIGAIGTDVRAKDMNFNQTWNQLAGEIDLRELASELAKLRQEMKNEAIETEHHIALGEIAKAEQAAKSGDGPKVLEHLRSAGTWVFGSRYEDRFKTSHRSYQAFAGFVSQKSPSFFAYVR